MRKVLIIGIDGGTFRAIKKYIGLLPTFKFLINNGCHGILKSTIPFLTVPAWPSFYTGMNPGNHGIFHFLSTHKFDLKDRKINTFFDVKAKSLWKILSENNKKCLVWNVPMTYPPEKINGKLVGGLLSLSTQRYAYPLSFERELRKQNYVIDSIELDLGNLDNDEKFEAMISVDKARYEIWKKYYKLENYDFSMIVFRCSDICGHDFWSEEEKVIKTYKTLDNLMARILKDIDEETALFVMSDHGFNTYSKTFNIMAWLNKEGYLKYSKSDINNSAANHWREVHEKNKKSSLLNKLFFKFKIDRQKLYRNRFFDIARKKAPSFIKNIIRKNIPQSVKTIDWQNTLAYAQLGDMSTWGININLKDREKNGVVDDVKYLSLKQEIISKLKRVTDENNDLIFSEVLSCEKMYFGLYLKEAPDIVFKVNGDQRLIVARFDDKLFARPTSFNCSYHDQDGIFMAYGSNIKKNFEIKASIIDVAPTVLNYLGIKNYSMDGKVLKNIFVLENEGLNRFYEKSFNNRI